MRKAWAESRVAALSRNGPVQAGTTFDTSRARRAMLLPMPCQLPVQWPHGKVCAPAPRGVPVSMPVLMVVLKRPLCFSPTAHRPVFQTALA